MLPLSDLVNKNNVSTDLQVSEFIINNYVQKILARFGRSQDSQQ